MRSINLKQFITLRRQLTEERLHIESRLREINEALGEMPALSSSTERAAAAPAASKPTRRGRRGSGGGQSLLEHVIEVLQSGPKTKAEVLSAVLRRGYKFATKDPLNSLGVVLYGRNPRFDRANGMFSLKGSVASNGSAAGVNTTREGKRTMSEAGRRAIAKAAKKRWAAARAAGRKSL